MSRRTTTYKVEPVRFDSRVRPDFQAELKARAKAYLDAQPNGPKANGFMWFKVVFFLVAYWTLWASLALWDHPVATTALLLVAFACTSISVAYNVSHDAVHHAIARSRWLNELLFQGTFNLLGPSASMFRLRHTIMHHSCVNIPGLDFNIESGGVLRFAPDQPWRPVHRYQHLYAPLLYMVFTLDWVFVKDWKLLRQTQVGNVKDIRQPWWRGLELLFWKLLYVTLMLVVPTLALERTFGEVFLGFLFFQFFVSFQLVLTFVGSHLNEGMVFVRNEPTGIAHSFIEHQILTSLDFHPRDPLVSFFFGGFNAHVAHHVFPQVCSIHYPELTRIIAETCAKHGVRYQEMSLATLYLAHFRYLRDLGQSREAPYARYQHVPPQAAPV